MLQILEYSTNSPAISQPVLHHWTTLGSHQLRFKLDRYDVFSGASQIPLQERKRHMFRASANFMFNWRTLNVNPPHGFGARGGQFRFPTGAIKFKEGQFGMNTGWIPPDNSWVHYSPSSWRPLTVNVLQQAIDEGTLGEAGYGNATGNFTGIREWFEPMQVNGVQFFTSASDPANNGVPGDPQIEWLFAHAKLFIELLD